jgi:hypothetical protein
MNVLARILNNCDMVSWHANAPKVGIPSPPYHPADLVEWLVDARHNAVSPAMLLMQAMGEGEWSLQWYPQSGSPELASQIRFSVHVGGERWFVWVDRVGGKSGRAAIEVSRFPSKRR